MIARAIVETRRWLAGALLAAALLLLGGHEVPRVAAQTATPGTPAQVSITVIERDGRLLPFEQFRAEVHDSCAVGGVPVPHLHTRTGGPAIAIDRTPVADPAPNECGFGALQGAAAGSIVRLANVPPADVQAWSALTGIPLTAADAVPEGAPTPGVPVPTPTFAPVEDGPTVSNTPIWSMLIVPLILVAGVAAGYLLANRGARRAPVTPAPAPHVEDYEPVDGDGTLRDRLARGHAGLFTLTAVAAPPLDAADEASEADSEAGEDAGDGRDAADIGDANAAEPSAVRDERE